MLLSSVPSTDPFQWGREGRDWETKRNNVKVSSLGPRLIVKVLLLSVGSLYSSVTASHDQMHAVDGLGACISELLYSNSLVQCQ